MGATTRGESLEEFKSSHVQYRDRVEYAVDVYAAGLMEQAEEYGEFISLPVQACANVLSAKSKRIRGILTIVGYEMLGGKDTEMINTASAAMEALQTYLVVIDDIQDQSEDRRGDKPAHIFVEEELLASTLRQIGSIPDDVTLNGALTLNHHALLTIGNLPDTPALPKLRALNALNAAMVPTGYGQTGDILAPVIDKISNTEANKANGDKTKHYTFRAPLEVGMHLAGASAKDIEAIKEYANNLGEAYQLRNDLEVTDVTLDNKDRGDDIRSGKRTLVLQYALSNDSSLSGDEKSYLRERVGTEGLSAGEVRRCQRLLAESGAIGVVEEVIDYKAKVGLESLRQKEDLNWNEKQLSFLEYVGRAAVA